MHTVDCLICQKAIPCVPARPRMYCSVACKAEAQRRAKPVTKEWLEEAYLIRGLDCVDIAAIVGRDPKSVWNWLKGFGIPTRSRGSSPKKGIPPSRKGTTLSPEHREKIRQARLADGHVPYLKNGQHHLKGKKGAETPNWRGGATPERQAFIASPEWKAAVRQVWHRDGARCRRCGLDARSVPSNSRRFAIHHIVSFAVKCLRCELANLVLLCRPCHLFVHSRANVDREFLEPLSEVRNDASA